MILNDSLTTVDFAKVSVRVWGRLVAMNPPTAHVRVFDSRAQNLNIESTLE